MIFLWILVCSAILLAGFVLWGYIGRNMWAFRYCIAVFAVIFAVSGLFSICMGSAASDSINHLHEDYETLMLYYETIKNTPNEYIRFDYHQNVMEFNERYYNALSNSKSLWIGAFYPNDGLNGIAPIEFNLVGDEALLEAME